MLGEMMKKSAVNKLITRLVGLILCLIISAGFNPFVRAEVENRPQAKPNPAKNPAAIQPQIELARDYYVQSGLSGYFQDLSLLWTEPLKRRASFLPGMTKVDPEIARRMREEVIKILQYDPDNLTALTLAGDYHYYFNQKETALWYYQQAKKSNPESVEAYLPLAGYYLMNWQPEPVIELLEKLDTPQAALRKGAAYIQLSSYPLALGCLLQTSGLSQGLRQTRDKDLLKVRLNLGDLSSAKTLSENMAVNSETGRLLHLELQGWLAWTNNQPLQAMERWDSGRMAFRDYPYWEYFGNWMQLSELGQGLILPEPVRDPEYRAVLKMIEGQNYLKEGNKDEAYRSFQEAIKPERKLLLAYLEIANIQMINKNYDAAIKWLNRGLELSPQFQPFLIKRAEAFEKKGQTDKAAADREVLAKITKLKLGESEKISIITHRTTSGQSFLSPKGQIKDLTGYWVSKNLKDWRFYPWSGQAVPLEKGIRELWVLPLGNGLTGEFFRIDLSVGVNGKVETPKPLEQPLVTQDQAVFTLPAESRFIVENISTREINRIYVSNQSVKKHSLPLTFFTPGFQELQCWYQELNGNWMSSKVQYNLAKELLHPNPIEYQISCESMLVNHRRVKLKVSSTSKVTGNPRISLGENGQLAEWIPLKEILDYQLTPGDGPKTIQARIIDDFGRTNDLNVHLVLDTTLPQISNIQLSKQLIKKTLSWQINEPVDCRIHTFAEDGTWSLQTVTPQPDGVFKAIINNNVVFCQWVVIDQAGNKLVVNDTLTNSKLRESLGLGFIVTTPVDHGQSTVPSVMIEIQPEGKSIIEWSLSNNLSNWSRWIASGEPVRWRVNPDPEESILFIRYRIKNTGKIKYQAIPFPFH